MAVFLALVLLSIVIWRGVGTVIAAAVLVVLYSWSAC
jgi:hypothetical protein